MLNGWQIDHLVVVVKDIDKAVRHYQRLFPVILSQPQIQTIEDGISVKACLVENQTLRLKLVQPVSGKSSFGEFLDEHGEGVSHIECRVAELQEERERLAATGIPVIASTKRQDGSDFELYFDTRNFGSVSFVLFSEPAPFPLFSPSEGNWKLHHLGFATRDIHKFADYYQSIGFKLLAEPILRTPGQEILNRWIHYDGSNYGRIPKIPHSRWECYMQNKQGTLLLTGCQPVEGKDLIKDFLDQHGDGVQHIHFLVNDLPKELANMVAAGFAAINIHKRPDGTIHESFYDTREIGNVTIALWQGPEPPFKPKPE